MKQVNQIKVFISCPADIKTELDSIRLIIEEINKTSGKQNSYTLECLSWHLDTYTQIGEDPQEVINTQLETEYDILVGLMWLRLGTPTKRDKSGTVEEINRAIDSENKELLIYFNTAPPKDLNAIDIGQLSQVRMFKEELTQKGVLYKEYQSIEKFESLFRINITNLISDRLLAAQKTKEEKSTLIQKNEKYASITDLINKVDTSTINSEFELDFFEVIEHLLSSLEFVTSSLGVITTSVNEFTNKMRNRTTELEKVNSIKDNRLKLNKIQIVVNLFAGELDEFSVRVNQELPRFSENFLAVGPLYSKILQFAATYEITENATVKNALLAFRDSVEAATGNSAAMLEQFLKWPPMTSRFNKA